MLKQKPEDINNDNKQSDLLKEMLKSNISYTNAYPVSKVYKVYPVSKDKCCDNQKRITSNDGNRTQKCLNCGWKLCYA